MTKIKSLRLTYISQKIVQDHNDKSLLNLCSFAKINMKYLFWGEKGRGAVARKWGFKVTFIYSQ